ncbi:MFS transporter [Acerihabitans sp. TG2]|uniref:MFS transporter n=1 Tax=Acerihabitans sp. TG2 TaxID=3096008 RepID=UPI002B234361|nr:MFS transporter [Acerihabitans sp. TG2]MEA9389276.1 MFS transporter [Acerihabitans sp. TG2]
MMSKIVPPEALNFRRALLAMLGLSLTLMLSALDQTVIGNTMPYIVADLGGFDWYAWLATGYLLTSIVTVPIFGRLGDYFGRKYFVITATLVFTLASLLCAQANDMLMLVLWRALQGIGGGMLIGTAFACIPELFPEVRRRLRWQILLSSAFSVVNALGPTLGGILTEQYGWRSVFYLNVPCGLLALVMAWRYLPYIKPLQQHNIQLDWLGALLVMLLLGSLQLGITGMSTHMNELGVIAWVFASLLSFLGLIGQQKRAASPLLPPSLFVPSTVRQLFILSTLAGAVMFTLLYFAPLLFQGGYGYSAQQAAWLLTPLGVSITLGAIINGRIVTRLRNPALLPVSGFLLLAAACIGLALCGARASFVQLLLLMLMCGSGLGFILLNLTLFTQTLAPREHLGIATALLQSFRLVGGLLGTAATSLLLNMLYHGLLRQTLGEDAADRWSDPGKLLGMVEKTATGEMVFARHALITAIDASLFICAVIAMVAAGITYRLSNIVLVSPQASRQPTS